MVNPAAALLFGYEAEEMIGRNVKLIMPEPHHTRHDNYISNYVHSGHAKIIGIGREVEGLKKDGHQFPVRLSVGEGRTADRRIFIGILHDLTQQKETERALQYEKERAQQYLDVASTIIVVIDWEEKITLLNNKGSEILGWSEEEALGQNWFDLVIPPESHSNTRRVFHKLLDGELKDTGYHENEIITRNGQHLLIAWRNAPVYDHHGQIIASISSGIDITQQRAAEERIIKLNAELEERVELRTEELANAVNQLLNTNKKLAQEIKEREAAERVIKENEVKLREALKKEKELSELKSRFVSMASHEFRTPLSTILSSADLIDAYSETDQQVRREKHTKRIKSAVANLTGILNDFLSLSRLEEGMVVADPSEFALQPFCREILDELQGLLKANQKIALILPEGETGLYLDKKFLKNILINLLSNAIKYSDAGPAIEWEAQVQGNRLLIRITDYGIGIPEEEQQHLFTRFFRAYNVENIQGTGLGLNIVKRYVDMMNGDISFESKPGKGTSFRVTLPQRWAPPVG